MKPLKFILNFFKADPPSANTLEISEEVKKQNWNIKLTELGVFSYNEPGFKIDLKTEFHTIKWTDIERLLVYKADLMTTDEICMDIVYDNKTIIITEETPGWYQFIEKLKLALPSIKKNWEALVLQSPFEYDLTTIYERNDRIMPEQSNFFSSIEGRTREEVSYSFQKLGWRIHKPSMKAYTVSNSWTDLVLDNDKAGLLLHGLIAYHPDNVKIIKQIFDQLECNYQFEFYDENHQLLEETKKGM